MDMNFDSIVQQVAEQLPDTPEKNLLSGALKTCIDKRKTDVEELIAAKSAGELTEQEFELELDREKKIVEAEMLTWQIVAKAEVQKVVNKAFNLLQQAVL